MNKYISGTITCLSTFGLTFFLSHFMWQLLFYKTFSVDYFMFSVLSMGGMVVGLNYLTGEWE